MSNQDRGSRIEDLGAAIENLDLAIECADIPVLLNPQSHTLNPAALQRVRWRCRRGLLELDIIFGRFVEAHYAQLNESEQQIFDELLDMPDNPLWDMISGRRMAETDAQAALLEKIKSV